MLSTVRAFSTASLKVVNDVTKQQFVINYTGIEAFLAYEKKHNHIIFHTTEVPSQLGGKGVGTLLAKHAFEYAKQNKLDVTCKCHFLAHFYEKNSAKYRDLRVKMELD